MAEMNEDIDSQKLKSVNSKLIDSELDKKAEEESKAPITLSRKMRWIVYFILLYISIVMELDQGVLSSTTDSLSKDMELNDSQLGGLGSMIFLGKSIGCLIFFTLINKLNRKYMLLVTSFLTILSLILTTQTKNLALLYICRIVVGIAQSYLGIYSPVWADQFGIHKYKSIILSLQHLSSSLGYLFGYVMGIWLGWVLAFYVQNIMLLIPIVILIFISDKFFSMSLMPVKSKLKLLKTENEDNKDKKEEKKDKIEDEIKKIKTTILDDSYDNIKKYEMARYGPMQKITEDDRENEETFQNEEPKFYDEYDEQYVKILFNLFFYFSEILFVGIAKLLL